MRIPRPVWRAVRRWIRSHQAEFAVLEKKTLSASERDWVARRVWSKLAALVDPSAWVWLDETGSHLGYTPTPARAPRGQRAYATAPTNRGENKTVLASLSLAGVGPTLRFDGPMTTARFDGYIRHVLAPTLRPGQIVVADNLAAHHSDRARAAIEARGAHLWHLPAYSRTSIPSRKPSPNSRRSSDAPGPGLTTPSATPPGPPSPPSPPPTSPAGSQTAAMDQRVKTHENCCRSRRSADADAAAAATRDNVTCTALRSAYYHVRRIGDP